MRNIASRRVRSGEADIYYEVHGQKEAPALLFVPGGDETHLHYYQQLAFFVRAGYRVLLTNLRGHWLSPCPPAYAGHSFYADDFIAILDAEGIETAAVKACSLGGFGGLRMALRFPERVHSLALTGSTAGVYSDENYANNEHALQQILEFFATGQPREFSYDAPAQTTLDHYLDMLGSADGQSSTPATAIIAMHSKSEWLSTQDLADYRVPTMLIGGDTDTFLPAGFQRHTVTLIPGAELSSFQDSGHRPFWTDPDRFNRVYADWLLETGWRPRDS